MIIMNMSAQDNDLKSISLKLDVITKDQKETAEKVSDIRERLFEPDNGLYSRVNGLQGWADNHEGEDQEQKEKYNDLHKDLKKTLESIEPLSDDYKIRMSRKKWFDRALYAILIAIIGIVVKNVMTIDDIHMANKIKQKNQLRGASHSVVITKTNK